jgi:hypothetical protein
MMFIVPDKFVQCHSLAAKIPCFCMFGSIIAYTFLVVELISGVVVGFSWIRQGR